MQQINEKIPAILCSLYVIILVIIVVVVLPEFDINIKHKVRVYKHENTNTCPETHSEKPFVTLRDSHDIVDGVCTWTKTDTDHYYIKQVCDENLEHMIETLNCKGKCEECTGPSITYSIVSVDPICLYDKETDTTYSYDKVARESTQVLFPKCLTPENVINPGNI